MPATMHKTAGGGYIIQGIDSGARGEDHARYFRSKGYPVVVSGHFSPPLRVVIGGKDKPLADGDARDYARTHEMEFGGE
jgi:hypothetical protein